LKVDNFFLNVLIVNYNTWEDTIECIESIGKSNYKKVRIFIVDNNSKDDSVEKIGNWVSRNKKFKLIKSNIKSFNNDWKNLDFLSNNTPLTIFSSSENLGFAKANNLFLQKFIESTSNEFLLMLNPDTVLFPNTIDELVKSYDRDILEIVGLKIKDYQSDKVLAVGGYNYNSLIGSIKPNFRNKNYNLSYIHGGAVFLNNKTLKRVGLLPTDYFLYFEDHDWCYNALRKNIRLSVCSSAVCKDKVGTSIGRGFMSQYYYTFNVLLFSKKYFKVKMPFVIIYQFFRVIYFFLFKKNFDAGKGILRGLYDYIAYGKRKIKIS
jgi:GT2 family glycosyltransferase